MKKIYIIIFVMLLVCLPLISNALTITTLAEGTSPTRSDFKTATSGSITSTAEAIPGYYLMSSASASEYGSLAASTYGPSWDMFYYNATASWSDTFINTSSTVMPYTYDFNISGGSLYIGAVWDHYAEFSSSYTIEFLLDGSIIWSSYASIQGGGISGATLTKSGTDLGGTYINDHPIISPEDYPYHLGDNVSASYTFLPYLGSLDLGNIAPGQSFILESRVSVISQGCDHGGGYAMLGDPLNLSINPGLYGSVSSPVPEPATILLLGSGLLGLIGFKRRLLKK